MSTALRVQRRILTRPGSDGEIFLKKLYQISQTKQAYETRLYIRHRSGLWARIVVQAVEFAVEFVDTQALRAGSQLGDRLAGPWEMHGSSSFTSCKV